MDPAHVPVSHHNMVGDRYGNRSLEMSMLQSLDKNGFSIRIKSNAVAESSLHLSTTFNAPSQVLIRAPFGDKGTTKKKYVKRGMQSQEIYMAVIGRGWRFHAKKQGASI